MHLIQKYGFTLAGEDQAPHNVLQGSYSFRDYQQIVYEEAKLKAELAKEREIAFNPERLLGVNLYPNRFDQSLLSRLRLSFLTSQTIRDIGGTKSVKTLDFKSDLDEFNETCTLQYLIDSVERDLNESLKPREVYEAKLNELTQGGQIDSMEKYNLMNVHRLHLDEHTILKKNLEYLTKMRKDATY